MKNSFRDIQKIYEEGYRDNSLDNSPLKYTPSTDLKHSYAGKGQLPMGVPGNAGSAYGFNSGRTTFEDEEGQTDSTIPKSAIIGKINELIEDADSKGMAFAVEQLYDLLQFIEQA